MALSKGQKLIKIFHLWAIYQPLDLQISRSLFSKAKENDLRTYKQQINLKKVPKISFLSLKMDKITLSEGLSLILDVYLRSS